jgi:hypothetical protein
MRLVATVLLASVVAACAAPTTAGPSATPSAAPNSTGPIDVSALHPAPPLAGAKAWCRSGDPLANVYSPDRLEVVSPCSTVGGTVRFVESEYDGDVHIDLEVDPEYRSMLDPVNITNQHGWLVTEIVPADEAGCASGQPPQPPVNGNDYGICTGLDLLPPQVGQHVWVTGPFVIDHSHGWTEIHPIWSLTTTKPVG